MISRLPAATTSDSPCRMRRPGRAQFSLLAQPTNVQLNDLRACEAQNSCRIHYTAIVSAPNCSWLAAPAFSAAYNGPTPVCDFAVASTVVNFRRCRAACHFSRRTLASATIPDLEKYTCISSRSCILCALAADRHWTSGPHRPRIECATG